MMRHMTSPFLIAIQSFGMPIDVNGIKIAYNIHSYA